MLAAEKRLATASTCAPPPRAPSGRRCRTTAPARATDWFPNGVDADYFSPTDGAYDADTISFIGRMDYYPNQECMARFCKTCGRCCARSGRR
jgi:polysaccharide biosynthesis protein PslH